MKCVWAEVPRDSCLWPRLQSEFDQLQSHFGHLTGGKIIQAAVSSTYKRTNMTIYNAGGSSSVEHVAVKYGIPKQLAAYEKSKSDIVPSMSLGTTVVLRLGHQALCSPWDHFCGLDYVFQHVLDRIAFIKIDVQGHEFEVLGGALSILNQSRPVRLMCSLVGFLDLLGGCLSLLDRRSFGSSSTPAFGAGTALGCCASSTFLGIMNVTTTLAWCCASPIASSNSSASLSDSTGRNSS